jgi:predicted nuclease with TOPRIM domain
MHTLQQSTERFCKDPVNVLGREKRFVIRRFHRELVGQGLQLFREVRGELDGWLKSALNPLSMQLKDHQKLLEHRVENLRKIAGDITTLQERVRQLEKQQVSLGKQIEDLTDIRDTLTAEPAPVRVAKVA